MNEIINYDKAVETIKTAILQSTADALLRHWKIHFPEFSEGLLGERSY